MAQSQKKYVSPLQLLVDGVLVIAFFVFMFGVVAPHVPSEDKTNIAIWAGLTSACMSAVFWICIQMFRVVYRFQHKKL